MEKKYSRAKLLINKIFNVTSHEWPRIIIAWLLRTFTMMTYIMGWTLIVAVYVIEMGIEELPFLFIANGLLVFMGSFVYSSLVQKYSKEALIIFTAVLGVILFGVSRFFFDSNILLFGLLFLIAESSLLSQINILLTIFVEKIFTPLEAQRAMPIIETAEPVGGILGGTLITWLAGEVFIGDLVYSMPVFLFLVAVGMFFYVKVFENIPTLKTKEELEEHENLLKMGRFKAGLTHIRAIPFLKSLLLIVLCQWFFVSMVDYQFTKYVHGSITHGDTNHVEETVNIDSHYEEDTHVNEHVEEVHHEEKESSLHEKNNEHLGGIHEQGVNEHLEGMQEQHSEETELTKGLGMLHIIFYILVLITRLFFSSRLYQWIGLVKSSWLYPISSIFATLGMMIHPGYMGAVVLKGTTEVFGSIHIDSYHNSYYGLKEAISQQMKEFLEGVVRPAGLILGTLILIVLQKTISGDSLDLTINILMMLGLLVMLYVLTLGGHQEKYTNVSKRNIDQPGNTHIKFTALDVLSQKGHKHVSDILTKNLFYKKDHERIRRRILKILGKIHDSNTIPEIVKCFSEESVEIQLSALQALSNFQDLGKHFKTQSFSKYRVIEALKELFVHTKSKRVKLEIINVFKNINHSEVIPFLLDILEKSDAEVRADCIYVCGKFHDISAAHYIEKYIDDENPKVKADTIIALWQFVKYRLKLLVQLISLLESKDRDTVIAGIYVLGETKSIQEIPRLIKFLDSEDVEIRKHAAIALGKMNHPHAIQHITDLILHPDKSISHHTKSLAKKVHSSAQEHIERILHQEAAKKVHHIIKGIESEVLEDLSTEKLKNLLDVYELIDEESEVFKIESILEDRAKNII